MRGAAVESADTSRRNSIKMKAKTVFLAIFSLSILVFLVSWYFRFLFGYVGAMHLAMLSLALFYLFNRDLKSFFKEVGLPGNIKTNIIYTVGGLVALILVLIPMSFVLSFIGMNDQHKVVEVANTLPLSVLAIAVLLAPISEEFFFRGFLSSRFGVLISSVIFGLFHFAYGSIVEVVGAFLVGIVFAVVYKRSGSIIPPIAIHMSYNLASIALLRGFL